MDEYKGKMNADLSDIAHKYRLYRLQNVCLDNLSNEVAVYDVYIMMIIGQMEGGRFVSIKLLAIQRGVYIGDNWKVLAAQ